MTIFTRRTAAASRGRDQRLEGPRTDTKQKVCAIRRLKQLGAPSFLEFFSRNGRSQKVVQKFKATTSPWPVSDLSIAHAHCLAFLPNLGRNYLVAGAHTYQQRKVI
jgi:hypothetical protein